jgi:excisionase family DNA binding protein
MIPLPEKSILTTHEAAKYLNVYTNTVIHWMNSGKLCGYRTPGGHRRILREELLNFVKNNNLEDAVSKKKPIKILIIEDDIDAMDLYISILEKDNYEIKKSYTGFSSGVAIDFKPDLIILDIMLPDFDGFRICDMLRKSPETAQTKILVISAISEMKKIKKMYDLGADDYLIKPFSISDLKIKIADLLKEPI